MKKALLASMTALLLLAAAASSQEALSIDQAVAAALAKDPGIESATLDWQSSRSKLDALSWKRYPSISASAGAQLLSPLPDATLSIAGFSATIPSGMTHGFSFGLNVQYALYDGNRLNENLAMAGLQSQGKDMARETAKRALAFDVRRAYWEAVRAGSNRATLEQNLELMKANSQLASLQVSQGVATKADQLAAQMRLEQAAEDLGDAGSFQRQAFLSLASLTGVDIAALGLATAAEGAALPFELTTKPDEGALGEAAASLGDTSHPDEAELVAGALARRPETRTAELSRRLAEHSLALSRAALYPTVSVSGTASYADPNQRVAFQTADLFTLTGSLGLLVSYDVSGVPAAMDDIKAQTLSLAKARSDETRQRNAVVMDVENALVNFERARRDLASTMAMVEQARENLRVVQGRMAAGSAKDIDLRSSKFDLLRMEFAVTNKRIDALIAQADLARATASQPVE